MAIRNNSSSNVRKRLFVKLDDETMAKLNSAAQGFDAAISGEKADLWSIVRKGHALWESGKLTRDQKDEWITKEQLAYERGYDFGLSICTTLGYADKMPNREDKYVKAKSVRNYKETPAPIVIPEPVKEPESRAWDPSW